MEGCKGEAKRKGLCEPCRLRRYHAEHRPKVSNCLDCGADFEVVAYRRIGLCNACYYRAHRQGSTGKWIALHRHAGDGDAETVKRLAQRIGASGVAAELGVTVARVGLWVGGRETVPDGHMRRIVVLLSEGE